MYSPPNNKTVNGEIGSPLKREFDLFRKSKTDSCFLVFQTEDLLNILST